MKGHRAWMAGQIRPVIGLSQAAQRDRDAFVGQHATSAAQEARGHAMAGDADACDRKLDDAAELAARAAERHEDSPPWLYFHSPALFTLQRGLAYRYLGRDDPRRNRRAVEVLAIGDWPVSAWRNSTQKWTVDYVYHLAIGHPQAGDPDRSCAAANEVSIVARQTGSRRLLDALRRLHPRLAQR